MTTHVIFCTEARAEKGIEYDKLKPYLQSGDIIKTYHTIQEIGDWELPEPNDKCDHIEFVTLEILRWELETDNEYLERRQKTEHIQEQLKEERYQHYLRLKKEFEN